MWQTHDRVIFGVVLDCQSTRQPLSVNQFETIRLQIYDIVYLRAITADPLWPEIDDFGTPKGVILGVVWGTISVTQNRTFSRSLLDHFFFHKNIKFCVFQVFTKFKNQIQIPALQSEPISGKHKTFSFFVILFEWNRSPFCEGHMGPNPLFTVFSFFFEKNWLFYAQFCQWQIWQFSRKTQMLITTDTFRFCTYKSVLLVRLTSVVGWKMRRLARRSVGH